MRSSSDGVPPWTNLDGPDPMSRMLGSSRSLPTTLAGLLSRPAIRNALGICSPSLAILGRCRCGKCRHLRANPPAPLQPVQGPWELDDAVGAMHARGECEECDRRRDEVDVDPWNWGPLR